MGIDTIIKIMEQCEKTNLRSFKCSYEGIEVAFQKSEELSKEKIERLTLKESFSHPIFREKKMDNIDNRENNDSALIDINACFVGIFSLSDKLKAGELKIKKGDILGCIEAMKIYNDIEAPNDGEIVEILVNESDIVECEQVLFRMRADDNEKI